jgi:hypothetical protein
MFLLSIINLEDGIKEDETNRRGIYHSWQRGGILTRETEGMRSPGIIWVGGMILLKWMYGG